MTQRPIPRRPPPPYRAVPGGSRGAGEGPPRATRAARGHEGARALATGLADPSPRTRANGAQSADSAGPRR